MRRHPPGSTQTMPSTIVYVSCAEDTKHIARFEFDQTTGSLHPRGTVPVSGTDAPSPQSLPLAISPDRKFLYAALRDAPFPLTTYAIHQTTGALTPLATTTLADSMC